MPHSFTSEQQKQYHSYLKVHLNAEELSLSEEEQIPLVEKKRRKQWWMLLFNILIILFFGYSFVDGITRLSDTIFYILIAVFFINMGLILYQTKRLGELITYLKWKKKS